MNKGCWEGRKVITYKRQGKWDLEIRRGGGQGKKLTSPVHIYIHVGMEETSLILLLYPNI